MIKYKTFLRAIRLAPVDARKAGKYLDDKRLSQVEKKILRAWLSLRLNKFEEIIEGLANITIEDQLLESMRLLMLGSAYNNKGNLSAGIDLMTQAWDLVKDTELTEHKFITIRNLFQVNHTLKENEKMSYFFNLLTKCERHPRFDESYFLCEFSYYTRIQDYVMAQKIVTKTEKRFSELTEYSSVYFLIIKIDLLVKVDDLLGARETLKRLKSHRNFFTSSNYRFILNILDNMIDEKPIYIYDWDFDKEDILFWQLKVLSSLEAREKSEAQLYWKKLADLSSNTYLRNFEYVGDKCLFSICLEKHLSASDMPTINVSKVQGKAEQLFAILEDAGAPIRKELLYELVWGEHIEDKDDLKKMTKTISVLQKKYNVQIKSIKGCYHLIRATPSKKEKAS